MGYKRDKLSVENQIVKNQKMVFAKYKLSVTEQRLILTLCSKISSEDITFKEFEMSVQEFCDIMELDNQNHIQNSLLKKKCEQLVSKNLVMDTGTKDSPCWTYFNWFHHIKYLQGKGIIKLQFHELLAPYLLFMKDNIYTKYKLGFVLNFKCSYSFRLYEMFKLNQKKKELTISVDELKEYLQVENIYKNYGSIKQKILNKAIKEINEKTDIQIKLSEITKVRKVTALNFIIDTSYSNQMNVDGFLEYERYKKMPKEKVAEILSDMLLEQYKAKINKDIIAELFTQYAITSTIIELKDGTYKDSDIKHPSNYFLAVLINKSNDGTSPEIKKTDVLWLENQMIKGRLNELEGNSK